MEGKPLSSPIPFCLPLPLRERAGVRGVDSHFKCHTWWIKISAGVAYPRHFRGVWL